MASQIGLFDPTVQELLAEGRGHELAHEMASMGSESLTPTVFQIVKTLNQFRRIFPPLKKLLFEAFWFVFAAVEIVRFLRSLL